MSPNALVAWCVEHGVDPDRVDICTQGDARCMAQIVTNDSLHIDEDGDVVIYV